SALLMVIQAVCQLPDHVTKIEAKPNELTTVSGKRESGKKIEDLRRAASSTVSGFPATRTEKCRGNHVLYMFSIPETPEVTIKLIPKDQKANFSLYGYQVGTSNFSVVPDLSQCTSCEADHKWDRPKRGQTQDHTRSISFNSIQNSYNI